ncbi:hypothetical protein E7T09_10265 [Deinococcus sp. KSM4-11]|uniref:hypothetical protein n=1 Tax=Deinococcus sp. KSM4-11 TaxID=2568654 RepID=UPI0010A581A2|nr:hypothetical protein [Deinococcus sp. KSM4-11]THF86495.1 hypothetical protein E7T09_10265 [Deinococcus sp. KSM4-11]
MTLTYPLTLEFKFSLFTELRVHDAGGQLIAVVKEKKFSVRDEVRVYADEGRQRQTHTMKAQGFLAGALDFKARRFITRADGSEVGSLQAQGLRTLWAATYDLVGPGGAPRFTLRDDQPWLGVVEGLLDVIPLVGDLIGAAFNYLVNPTYTVTDTAGAAAYRVHKKRSFLSRRFTIEELQPRREADEELVLLGLIQLVLRERERG